VIEIASTKRLERLNLAEARFTEARVTEDEAISGDSLDWHLQELLYARRIGYPGDLVLLDVRRKEDDGSGFDEILDQSEGVRIVCDAVVDHRVDEVALGHGRTLALAAPQPYSVSDVRDSTP
jgi:hypothetical protein